MFKTVGSDYGFDHGEIHDFNKSKKHLKIEQYKQKETMKTLIKMESEIKQKRGKKTELQRKREKII